MAMQRTVRVRTVLGEALLFRAMVGREGISEPYQYQLTLVSDDDSVAFDDLLGTDMTVEVDVLGDEKRYFHGLVSHFSYVGTEGASSRYEAVLRPWLWFLTRSADCRIFQERTAVEIIKEIFAKYPNAEFEDRLGETYAKRDLLRAVPRERLQFRQPAHGGRGHLLLLRARERQAHAGAGGRPERPRDVRGVRGGAVLPARRARPARARPRVRLESRRPTCARAGTPTRASISRSRRRISRRSACSRWRTRWPRARSTTIPAATPRSSQGERLARLRLEELLGRAQRFFGEGIAAGLAAGNRFTLTRYPRQDQNARISAARGRARDLGPGLPQPRSEAARRRSIAAGSRRMPADSAVPPAAA